MRVAWIDVPGTEPVYIEAAVDLDAGRIQVDDETLERMAIASERAALTDNDDVRDFVDSIRSAPRDEATGLRDVTEVGGGWDQWSQSLDMDVVDDPHALGVPLTATRDGTFGLRRCLGCGRLAIPVGTARMGRSTVLTFRHATVDDYRRTVEAMTMTLGNMVLERHEAARR